MMAASLLNLIKLRFFRSYPSLKPHILFYSNGLDKWHGFPDITHINVNNGYKSAILSMIELKFLQGMPPP